MEQLLRCTSKAISRRLASLEVSNLICLLSGFDLTLSSVDKTAVVSGGGAGGRVWGGGREGMLELST